MLRKLLQKRIKLFAGRTVSVPSIVIALSILTAVGVSAAFLSQYAFSIQAQASTEPRVALKNPYVVVLSGVGTLDNFASDIATRSISLELSGIDDDTWLAISSEWRNVSPDEIYCVGSPASSLPASAQFTQTLGGQADGEWVPGATRAVSFEMHFAGLMTGETIGPLDLLIPVSHQENGGICP